MKLLLIAAIGLFVVADVHAQDGNTGDGAALVRAMRADEMILEFSKSALLQARSEGHITSAQYDCFQKLPASAFTADLGKFLVSQFSRDEIIEALAFYRSPTGVKVVDSVFVILANAAAITITVKPTNADAMSVDDMKAAREFSETGVGQQLVVNNLVMKSPESREIARRIVGKRLIACGAKVSR